MFVTNILNFAFQSSASKRAGKMTPTSRFLLENNGNETDDSPASIVDVYNDQV
jgi:hypothetical protein